jgi:trehalose 6-phosphate phosphatase
MGQPLRSPDALAPLLAAARLGVLTDFDGTIAAIATRPEGAVASPIAREALARLARHLPLVGAISGRALFDLRAKLDLPELLYIGSHGLTWWYQGFDELPEEALPYVAKTEAAKGELAALLAVEGVRFEDKGAGMAIHYRLAADHDAARAAIIEAVSGSPAAR